jgi:hypothetical protein
VLWAALGEAERGLVAALEGKAKAHARIVRGDVELAIRLGIPLDELPGAFEYLEGGAQADPDIRFVAITDTSLQRLHYGGIGRARLDPLLTSEAMQDAAERAASHHDQPLRTLSLDGFSITLAPLLDAETHAGFIVVAVQGRQVQEALIERLTKLLPAALAFMVLLVELVAWTTASALGEPWRRLRRMMARFADGQKLIWSERHDRSELGMAARFANGVFHRLRDRVERLGLRGREVERAVFDQDVAAAVRQQLAELDRPPLAVLTAPQRRAADRRASDVQPALVLFVAAAVAGLVAALAPTAMVWPPSTSLVGESLTAAAPWLGLGGASGLAVALLLRRPGWVLVLAGLLITTVALAGTSADALATACLSAAIVMTIAAAWLYLRGVEDLVVPLWLVLHAAAGITVGGLIAWTLLLEDRAAVLPWLQLLLLVLAVLASNRAPVVRRQLFAASPSAIDDAAGPA